MVGRVGGVGEGWRVGVVQGAPSAVGAGVLGAAGLVRRVLLNAAWRPKSLCARTTQPRRERGGRGRNGGGGGPTRSGERGAAVGGGRGRGGARGGAEARGRGRASHRGEKMAVSRSRRLPTSKRGRGEGHRKQGGRGGGRGLRVGRHAGRCWSRGRGGLVSRTPCRHRAREVLYDDVSPPKRWSRRRAATGCRTPTPGGFWATRGASPAAVTCAGSRKPTAAGGLRGWRKVRREGIARAVRGAGRGLCGETAHPCHRKPRSTASSSIAHRKKSAREASLQNTASGS